MKGRFVLLGAAAMLAGCQSLGDLTVKDDFPPPVVAGVTRFMEVVPDRPLADTAVPPAVVWGVTKFPETVVDAGVPDSSIDKPVMWVRFGVTREAAQREAAERGIATGGGTAVRGNGS